MRLSPELLENARRISRAHARELLAKANVVGVGVGRRSEGEAALVVMVTQKLPRSQLRKSDLVPQKIEGIPVEVRVVGELKADAVSSGEVGPAAKGDSDETD